jgi:hypothetical protein
MGTRRWEGRRGMGGLEVEEGVGVVREGVGDAWGASFKDVNVVAAIVGEGRSEIVTAKAVGSPRRPGIGGLVHCDELPWRVEGVGKEIDGISMDAMVCRDGGVAVKGAEVAQCKFDVRKEMVPEIKGELGVNRGEGSNHVVFEGTDSSFSKISAMVGGRLELNSDRCRWGAKIGGEIRREFVVDSEVGDSVATGVEESDSRRMSFEIGSSRFGTVGTGSACMCPLNTVMRTHSFSRRDLTGKRPVRSAPAQSRRGVTVKERGGSWETSSERKAG